MKAILISVISISIFLTTSCTKESLLEVEINPSLTAYSENSQEGFPQIEEVAPPKSYLGKGTSTIQSLVRKTTEVGGELEIQFSNQEDFNGFQPVAMQDLEFTDAQNNLLVLSMPVVIYGDSANYYQITLDLENRDLSAWELKPTQMIVVEDITIN